MGQVPLVSKMEGTFSGKKTAVLLDFVQITSPPPILDRLYNFFRCQNSRFESQFRTKNTMYIQPKNQLKVQIIGILQEIHSYY